jgi:hypothetical protein
VSGRFNVEKIIFYFIILLATRVAPESIATHNVVAFILMSVLMEIKNGRNLETNKRL